MFIQLFAVYTYGSVELQFQWLKSKAPFDNEKLRHELLQKINQALNTKINTIDKRPSFKVELFGDTYVLDDFFEVVKWYIDTIKLYYKIS